MRIEAILGNGNDATVLAHFERIKPLRVFRIHPVLAFELCYYTLNRTLDAEWPATLNAIERLFFLEHARSRSGGAEVDLRLEIDHLFRAGRLAQPALHTGILGKAQQRPLWIVAESAGRAGCDARQTKRATGDVDLDRPKWRICWQRNDIDRHR